MALEISRNEASDDGDLTPEIFKVLASLTAVGRACSVNGFKAEDWRMVRVTCGRHYLTMSRELAAAISDKPFVAYGFFDGLLDETAKLVELPKSQN